MREFGRSDAGKGAAVLLLAALLDVAVVLGLREMAPMFSDIGQYALRLVLATLAVFLLGLALRKSLRMPRRAALWAVALGGVSAASVVLFVVSLNATKVGNAFVLCYGGSILGSLLLGRVIFGERATVWTWSAVALSVGGLSMYADALSVLSVGAVAGVASGLLDAVVNALRKKLGGYDRQAILLHSYAVGAVLGLALLLLPGEPVLRQVSWWPVVVLLLTVAGTLVLSQLLLYGFAHAQLSVGTIILAGEIFFAALAGRLLYAEFLTAAEIAGGVMIFSAAALSAVDVPEWWRSRRGRLAGTPVPVGTTTPG